MERETKKKHSKSSLSKKLLMAMLLVVLISSIASVAMNRVLLGPYYYYQQARILNVAADEINGMYTGELNERVVKQLNQLGYRINGLILIYDEDGQILYSSRAFQAQTVFSVTDEEPGGKRKIDFGEGILRKNWSVQTKPRPFESWRSPLITVEKELANGDRLLLQTSETALEESVGIINHFSLYPAMVALTAAVLLAMYLTKRISRPVVELTGITQRMKNLDFSSRYEGAADDEIGELGRNFNDMAETLDRTIGELNQANEQLKEDIEREKAIEEARKNFISNVSHELKTPISLIRGYAEGIRDQVIEPQEFEDYLSVIIEESEHMSAMVRELLTLSKLESHHVQTRFEPVDLREVLGRVLEMFSYDMQKSGVQLEYRPAEGPQDLICDQDMLETMLTNFVSNALDHVEGEKRIRITVEETAATLAVQVFNTGKVIPDNERDKIWDSFYKVDKARTRAYGGTGLGLAIVKNMVEIHQGSYGVENQTEGVTFFIRLPKDGPGEKA